MPIHKKESPPGPQIPRYEEAFQTLRQLLFSDRREWNESAKEATTEIIDHMSEKNHKASMEIKAAEELIKAKKKEIEVQTLVSLFMEIYRSYASGQRTAYLMRVNTRNELDKQFRSLIEKSYYTPTDPVAKEAREIIVRSIGEYLHTVFQLQVSIIPVNRNEIRCNGDKVSVTVHDYKKMCPKDIKFDLSRAFGLENIKGAQPADAFHVYEFLKKV